MFIVTMSANTERNSKQEPLMFHTFSTQFRVIIEIERIYIQIVSFDEYSEHAHAYHFKWTWCLATRLFANDHFSCLQWDSYARA